MEESTGLLGENARTFFLRGKDGLRNEMTSLSKCVSRMHGDRCQKQAHFPKEEEIEKKIGFLPEQVVC